jgi:hypothetical protein
MKEGSKDLHMWLLYACLILLLSKPDLCVPLTFQCRFLRGNKLFMLFENVLLNFKFGEC